MLEGVQFDSSELFLHHLGQIKLLMNVFPGRVVVDVPRSRGPELVQDG